MLFFGEYEHTIDAKGRLAIPAVIRKGLRADADGDAWFAVPWRSGLIRLYTDRMFHELAVSKELTLTPDEDEAEIEATLFGLSARIEMDSVGRILLPEEMLAQTSLGSEVVLVGARDRLEIRDRAEWRQSKKSRMEQLPELLRRTRARRAAGPHGGEV